MTLARGRVAETVDYTWLHLGREHSVRRLALARCRRMPLHPRQRP